MKTFAANLAELIRESGLSQEALGKLVGVHRSQVSRWVRGEGGIDDQKLARLADVLSEVLGRKVTVDFILSREDRAPQSQNPFVSRDTGAPRVYPTGMTRQVPVFDRIGPGAEPHLIGQEDVPMSELQGVAETCFFLEVQDDSMSGAGILAGHHVLIDPGAEIQDGDTVLVAVEGEEQAVLRRFFHEGQKVLLVADNTASRPRLVDPQSVRIFGKMMWGKYYPRK